MTCVENVDALGHSTMMCLACLPESNYGHGVERPRDEEASMLTALSSSATAASSKNWDERLLCAHIVNWAQVRIPSRKRGAWRKKEKYQRGEHHLKLKIPPPQPVIRQLVREKSTAPGLDGHEGPEPADRPIDMDGREGPEPADRPIDGMIHTDECAEKDMGSLGLGQLMATKEKTGESALLRKLMPSPRSPRERRNLRTSPRFCRQSGISNFVSPPPSDEPPARCTHVV